MEYDYETIYRVGVNKSGNITVTPITLEEIEREDNALTTKEATCKRKTNAVVRIDAAGNEVTFKSVEQAAKQLKICTYAIYRSIKLKNKLGGGYKWRKAT